MEEAWAGTTADLTGSGWTVDTTLGGDRDGDGVVDPDEHPDARMCSPGDRLCVGFTLDGTRVRTMSIWEGAVMGQALHWWRLGAPEGSEPDRGTGSPVPLSPVGGLSRGRTVWSPTGWVTTGRSGSAPAAPTCTCGPRRG